MALSNPLTVLIVEDHLDAAAMLKQVLTHYGYQVHLAHNGFEALELASRVHPRVVISDIGLPDIDGNELARQLRKLPGLDCACMIAMTGYGQASDRDRAEESGFNYFVVKPVPWAKLAEVLGKCAESTFEPEPFQLLR